MKLRSITLATLATFAVTSSVAQDYDESCRSYFDGPLRLEEFKGRVPNDTNVVFFSWAFNPKEVKVRKEGVKYTYFDFVPELDMTESWVRPSAANAQTLRMCQAGFDLLRIYSAQASHVYASRQTEGARDVMRYYANQYQHRFDDLQYLTAKGTDEQALAQQEALIALELQHDTVFDPSQVVLTEPSKIAELMVGASMSVPMTDYFKSPFYGFSFGFGYGTGRHLALLDMNMQFGGEGKKLLPTKNGAIEPGDDVQTGTMTLQYGYQTNRDFLRAFYPLVGVGVHFFDGPEYESDDPKKRSNEKAGFSLSVGCIYDLPVTRSVHLRTESQKVTSLCSGIRLRPTIAMTQLADGPGWFPTFQLNVSYYWRSAVHRDK